MTESFTCPLCQGVTCTSVLQLRDRVMRTTNSSFSLVRCRGCGLLRLHPAPDDDTLASSYSADYAPHVRPGLSGLAKGVLERRSVRLLDRYLRAPRAVLDVGCATGDMLAAVRARGNLNVTGIEPGAEAAGIARRRGLNVVTGDLAAANLEDGSFDTVIVSHTLEHVDDPLVFLSEVHSILKRGGALLIWIPNVDSVEARVFGHYWIGYDAPRHLTTFSTGTLARALVASGYQVDDITHDAVGLEWAWGLRLIVRERIPEAERILSKLHPLLIILFTPLALISSRLRKSGRIRVIASRAV